MFKNSHREPSSQRQCCYRALARAPSRPGDIVSNLVRILLAIFLPPLAVLMTAGIGLQFLLNILLTVLGIVPGMVHALWIVMRDR
jgi:uncharacterized membrane protein YqaE (UPF0057 family)